MVLGVEAYESDLVASLGRLLDVSAECASEELAAEAHAEIRLVDLDKLRQVGDLRIDPVACTRVIGVCE